MGKTRETREVLLRSRSDLASFCELLPSFLAGLLEGDHEALTRQESTS